MSAINPPQAVALRDIRTDDVATIESGDDELGSTITGRVHGVDTCKTAILFGDQIWYSLADGSDWRYVSGYRRTPEYVPGTRGTIRGLPAIVAGHGRVVAINPAYADQPTDGIESYRLEAGFVPDALPTRDEIADAMHDDHLPNGEPRLGLPFRLILADAVLALLTGGAS